MLSQDPEGNFVLTISNQSSEVSPVDIRVMIDGEVAVDEAFAFGEGQPAAHGWKEFRFRLAPGTRRLRAVSQEGEAELEVDVEVADPADAEAGAEKHFGLLMYWCSSAPAPGERRFTFQLADHPISFM